MVLYLETPDYEEFFKTIENPIIINNLPYTTTEEKEAFNNLIMTVYYTDTLPSVPMCHCGMLRGGHYDKNVICGNCGTTVSLVTEKPYDSKVWVAIPSGFKGFIIPKAWNTLTRILSPKGFNIVEWLISPSLEPNKHVSLNTKQRIKYFQSINWPRGLNNFIDNFDHLLNIISVLTKNKYQEDIEFLRDIKHLIFPRVLPLPNKSMLICEKTQIGSYADNETISGAIDAAKNIASIYIPRSRSLSNKQIEQRVVNCIRHLYNYYDKSMTNSFRHKKGWLRGQVFRGRVGWSARCVTTSNHGIHRYEELKIPWTAGVVLLRVHLTAKLEKRGYPKQHASTLIEQSINMYNVLVDELLRELILEAPAVSRISPLRYGMKPLTGLACTLQRNPSLDRLSMIFQQITEVFTDLTDKTSHVSVLVLRGLNMDFDGDEGNIQLLQGENIINDFKSLQPHYGIHSIDNLMELNQTVRLPDVTVSVWGNRLNSFPNDPLEQIV